jgi:small multidrug resistance family-3 protein
MSLRLRSDDNVRTHHGNGRNVLKHLHNIQPLILLSIATVLEAGGDAVIRMGIYHHAGLIRLGLFLAGAALLFCYGSLLNLAPLEFGRVVGLYIATLFVVWQLINYIAFRSLPTLPITVGGALIIAGGVIVTYWAPTAAP